MSREGSPRIPSPAGHGVEKLVALAFEADSLLSCFYDRFISGELKRAQIEESKMKLLEFRELICKVLKEQLTEEEQSRYSYSVGQFDCVRLQRQEMEDELYGGPGGPMRCPPVEALNFAEDSKTSIGSRIQRRSAPATQTGVSGDSVFGTEDDSIFLSTGLMTSALLERTLQC